MFYARLRALSKKIIRPITITFRGSNVRVRNGNLYRRTIRIRITNTRLRTINFRSKHSNATKGTNTPVISIPRLRTKTRPLRPYRHVHATLNRPMTIGLGVSGNKINLFWRSVMNTLFYIRVPRLTIIVIMRRISTLNYRDFTNFIRPLYGFIRNNFVTMVGTMRPNSSRVLYTRTLYFLNRDIDVPLRETGINIRTSRLGTYLLRRLIPIRVATLTRQRANNLNRRLCRGTGKISRGSARFGTIMPNNFRNDGNLFNLLLITRCDTRRGLLRNFSKRNLPLRFRDLAQRSTIFIGTIRTSMMFLPNNRNKGNRFIYVMRRPTRVRLVEHGTMTSITTLYVFSVLPDSLYVRYVRTDPNNFNLYKLQTLTITRRPRTTSTRHLSMKRFTTNSPSMPNTSTINVFMMTIKTFPNGHFTNHPIYTIRANLRHMVESLQTNLSITNLTIITMTIHQRVRCRLLIHRICLSNTSVTILSRVGARPLTQFYTNNAPPTTTILISNRLQATIFYNTKDHSQLFMTRRRPFQLLTNNVRFSEQSTI